MSDNERGLYQKYDVRRLNDLAGKHEFCRYFVLDLNHDPHAHAALEAYAKSCGADYPMLARDLKLEAFAARSIPKEGER